MSLYIYPSWDFARIGTLTFTLDDDGVAGDVTFSTGVYAHLDYSTVAPTVTGAFKAALQSEMDTISGGAGTYSVTYTAATRKYTIAYSAGNFSLAFSGAAGTIAKNVLGFTGNKSGAATYDSDIAVYYAIAGTEGAQTEVYEYEPGDIADVAEGDDGSTAMIARSTAPVYYDATIPYEPKAIVYTHHVVAANPWTWQMFFPHIRTGNHHFAMSDSGTGDITVHRMRKDGVSFAPELVTGDKAYQEYLHIPLRTYMIGRV